MTEPTLHTLVFAAVLAIVSVGCGGAGEEAGPVEGEVGAEAGEGAPAAEPVSEEPEGTADYESLAAHYEQMLSELPAAGPGEMGRMRGMAGQMRHFAGMMEGAGPMRGERMGMGRGPMRGMHGGAMGAGGASGMAEWHRQMAELHRQWAEEPAAAGNQAFAEHLAQMAARHQSLAEAFDGEAIGSEMDGGAGDGVGLYAAYCSGCHGPEGQGVSGAFPPLAGSPWVVGSAEQTAGIVLRGLHGPLEVGGETYYGVMPSFASRLDDEQLAAILTFVRSSWGNQASAVTPEQVAGVRTETAGRASFTAEELEAGDS